MQGVGNSLITVAELVPFYSVVVIAFAVFCLIGIGFYVMPLRKSRLPGLSSGILACVLVFVGIFVTRFTFYMMHMTVGLGI